MTARVLVVDDVEANRRLLEAKLGHEYFEVELAKDGAEALKKVQETEYDIILLDVMMPGIDGYQVCEKIKANPALAHIPVVMVTALGDREHRLRGLQAGAEDFLTKPINDFALMSRMRALMRFNRVVSELRQREANGRRVGIFEAARSDDHDRPARVFVIDEDPRNAQRIKRMLSDRHKVVTMYEADGLAANDTTPFDLIIMTLTEGRFDPLRLCATLLNNEATRNCGVIVVAEPGEESRAMKALEIGASDVISAPLDSEELLARVRTQARRARYLEILRRRVDQGLELAVKDQLTGLYNRRYMTSHLQQWMRRALQGGRPVSLVVIDLDHFKRINDCFGHQAGDEVLREVTERIGMNIRPADIACRYGGEEFIIILPETEGDMACSVAERIRRSVAGERFSLPHDEKIEVTVSIGVATSGHGGDTPAELIERADQALYEAKNAGRNRVQSKAA